MQRCLLFPLFFLQHLDFTDDITMLVDNANRIKDLTGGLQKQCKKVGLVRNPGKTKLMSVFNQEELIIIVDDGSL